MAKKQKIEPVLPFNSDEFQTIWAEWMAFRGERKLPAYKPIGLKRTLAALVRDSNNDEKIAIAIIIQSIEKNWQGLFPVKNNTQTNGRTTNYWQNIGLTGVNGSTIETAL